MTSTSDIAKFVAADVRYGITVMSAFILGFILLFLKELTPYCREVLVPALAVYTVGTALIGHIQILVTVSTNTKSRVDGGVARGINERHLRLIIMAHILWFAGLIGFLMWRAVLSTNAS